MIRSWSEPNTYSKSPTHGYKAHIYLLNVLQPFSRVPFFFQTIRAPELDRYRWPLLFDVPLRHFLVRKYLGVDLQYGPQGRPEELERANGTDILLHKAHAANTFKGGICPRSPS
jgi:hypothetical protein